MVYRALVDATILAHGLFIVFVVAGGFLTWRWRWVAWLHLPCAAWGVLIEYAGWVCPLTPLENHFRSRAGLAGYGGGFIGHYPTPPIYPQGVTPPSPAGPRPPPPPPHPPPPLGLFLR